MGHHLGNALVPAGADATEIRFVDAQNGWAAGGLRTILHTTNGGQTWVLQSWWGFVDPETVPFLWAGHGHPYQCRGGRRR